MQTIKYHFRPTLLSSPCKSRSAITSLGLLLFISFIFPQISIAASTETEAEKAKINRKIKMHEINVVRLQEGLEKEKENYSKAAQEEISLLGQLETIDLKLQKQQAKLESLKQQMARQAVLISSKEKQLRVDKTKKRGLQDHLQKRINSYYKLDRISLINIIFSANSLPDVLIFHDSFQTLLTYDQEIIKSFRNSIAEMDRSREALTLEESILHDFIQRTDKEKEMIERSKEEMIGLLSHIRTQAVLHKQAVVEIEKEADKLTASLALLKNKEEKLKQDFFLSKGTLPLPVEGSVITLYNEETVNQLGISKKSNGIAISAPDGTPVKSIFKGTIFYSGYLRGHGNTIVVDHGHQYYSIISRVEQNLVKKGDVVKQGTVVGTVGDTAMIIDDGVQLEIRHGSKALNPMNWLNQDKILFHKHLKRQR